MGKVATDTSDWIGRRFGKLVVAEIGKRVEDRPACLCYCDCDPNHERPILVRSTNLKSGRVSSCGCGLHDLRPYTGSVKIGQRSGRLTVVSLPTSVNDRNSHGDYVCHCVCDCGNQDYVCSCTDIASQSVKSCGCIDRERLKPIHIGQEFDQLTVVEEVARDPITNRRRYLCQCKCGGSKIVAADKLIGGETKSCGCLVTKLKDEYTGRIKVGDVFEHLTVIDIPAEHRSGRARNVICKCDCGTERFVANSSNLLSGSTKSCGCRRRTKKTAEEYALEEKLHGMKQRCYNPNFPGFQYWGGKGITVCDEWMNDTLAFIKWALANGYKLGDTIDRIDNSKGYSPDNCRFTDMKTQQNNKTNNVLITVDGVTRNLSQWADHIGVSPDTLSHALKRKTKEEGDRYIRDREAKKQGECKKSPEELRANLEKILFRK